MRFDLRWSAFSALGSSFSDTGDRKRRLADRRVSNYSYKVNGTEKAKTVNTYDTYRRLKQKTYTVDGKVFTKSIEYDMAKVSRLIDSAGGTTRFEYDAMGRISKEKDDSGNILKSYTYDSYGQLIREDNAELDKTFVFGYDNNGNMESKKTYRYTTDSLGTVVSQQNFHYSATHPDRLIKCDSTSINYDAAGYPTTCNGYTVSFTRGKLSNLTYGSLREGMSSNVYTYNAFGQRIETNYRYMTKPGSTTAVVMGMVTAYTQVFRYDRFGRLIYERTTTQYYGEGSGTKKTVYLYDESGIIGMLHTSESGTTAAYYFARNLLGDVIGIYNTSGTKVGAYAYDAFGNCKITLDTDGIASRNPIRYRGYYYDKVSGTYDLNARYYSPEWHRFISPDDTSYLDPESANGLNLYAYCYNDPVNYCDPSGHFALTTFGVWAIVGIVTAAALIGGGAQLASNALTGETGSELWRGVAGAALGSGANALALCLSPFTGGVSFAFAAAIGATVQTGVDTLETVVRQEQVNGWQTVADFGLNFVTALAGNWLGARLVPTNNGWFKPQKFLSVFIRPYGQKILLQTTIGAGLSGIVNFARKFNWSNVDWMKFILKHVPSMPGPIVPMYPIS